MLRRRPVRTRAAALTAALLLPLALLAACGDDTGEEQSSGAGLEAVTVEGEPGTAPEVTWEGDFDPAELETEVLVEGDGPVLEEGDSVLAHLWIGNGFSQDQAFSTYDSGQPERIAVGDDVVPAIKAGIEGHPVGSRVVVAAPPKEAFGDMGNPALGIGNTDPVLLVVDLIELYVAPEPKDVPPQQLPSVVLEKGEPVGFDFSGVPEPEPDGELLRSVLKEGNGKTVTTDMTVTADYLGAVYGAKKPFDESYSKKPVPFALTGVVEGWTYGLEGLEVGSRVLLQIPPELGYGGQEQAGIPANSTLYFVIDIVSAK